MYFFNADGFGNMELKKCPDKIAHRENQYILRRKTMKVSLNLFATVAIALFTFYVGAWVKKKVPFFTKYCIPTPVVGGILFALLNLGFHETGLLQLKMDGIFQNLCMVAFFTSIGYSASFKVIASAGKPIFVLTAITAVLISLQNLAGGYLASLFGLSKLMGLTLGSIPLVGGHGNAGAFGPQIEAMGNPGAATSALAAATFGLVLGSLMGGPTADWLIRHFKVETPFSRKELSYTSEKDDLIIDEDETGNNDQLKGSEKEFVSNSLLAVFHLFISMACGVWISQTVKAATDLVIPIFLCSMCVAVVIRNLSEFTGKFQVHERECNMIGSMALNIFLALAMMSLQLWQLADLAIPMTIILLLQTAMTVLFVAFVTFSLMGKDYEAAAICAAQVGYGLGATPNAMANIAAVSEKYGPAPKAFFVIPIVGGLFTSLCNAALITFFINFF